MVAITAMTIIFLVFFGAKTGHRQCEMVGMSLSWNAEMGLAIFVTRNNTKDVIQ